MSVDSTAIRYKIAGSTDVGSPPKEISIRVIEKMYFYVFNFANREEKRGERVDTEAITAHGQPWMLSFYPRGH